MTEQPTERSHPDMWVDPEDDPRDTGAVVTGEKAVVLEYLEFYRKTLELKCSGLDAEQMALRSVPPSTLSLLGLVRHLAKVEHSWFRRVLSEQPELVRPFWNPDEPDLDFNGAVADDAVVAEAWEAWRREVAHAREVIERLDFGDTVMHGGQPTEVRDIVVHMVEEYARHLGHADLLRECIDGRTGQ
jgi:uncharacterized damage-inducible protein DinB